MSNNETASPSHVGIPIELQKDLKKFLKTVALTSRTNQQPTANTGAILSDHKKGYVQLTQGEAGVYQGLIERLGDVHLHTEQYSKSFASKAMRNAVLLAASPKGNPPHNANLALEEVIDSYKAPLERWRVVLPLSGFTLHKRTQWQFGRVLFMKTTSRRLKKDFGLRRGAERYLQSEYVACVEVDAVDSKAALRLGREIIELHATILDALSSIAGSTKPKEVFSNYGLIGEVRHAQAIVCLGTVVSSMSRCRTIAMGGFTPHVLRGGYSLIKRFSPRYIDRELREQRNSLFMQRTLPALKWLGRAVHQSSNEEIFLEYFLALEAIYFETQHNGELMKELQRRIHRLNFTNTSWLGSTVPAFSRFEDLYTLRSKIVHRGGIEVSDNEVKLIRDLVVGSLYKLLYQRRFRIIKSADIFEQWLEKGK